MTGLARKVFSGTPASSICARARSSALAAAMPASSSPARAGDALAKSARRPSISAVLSRKLPFIDVPPDPVGKLFLVYYTGFDAADPGVILEEWRIYYT